MSEAGIHGAGQLEAVARALKEAGDEGKGLRRELLAGIRKATKPITAKVRSSLSENLPHRGGLADFMASATIAGRTRTAGKQVGVRIAVVKKGHDIPGLDEGLVRHPVWGNRKARWVSQSVPAGLVSRPVEESMPEIQAGVLAAIEATAEKIARSV